MIPNIYNDRINDKNSSYGSFPKQSPLGRLNDCIYCKLTRERNGQDEIEFSYPIDGIHYDLIQPFRIVAIVGPGDTTQQGYIIYKITKQINRTIIVNAYHISYLLKWCTYNPSPKNDVKHVGYYVQYLLDKFISEDPDQYRWNNNYPIVNGMFFDTYSAILGKQVTNIPSTVSGLLAGSEGSVIDRLGGDIERGNTYIHRVERIGSDKGFEIRYGKNMTGITWYADYSDVYTACVPYWKNGDTIVKPEDTYSVISSAQTAIISNYNIVNTDHVSDYPYLIVKPLDLSSNFENAPTVSQLQSAALSYMNTNRVWEPTISVDVNFVDISKSSEYEFISNISYSLGDDVKVINEELGIEVKARVESIEYDVLGEQITNTRIGNKKITYADVINKGR